MPRSGVVGRRVGDEADGLACLAAAAAAGLTPHVWAGVNGVATRSLSQWRRRIEVLDARAARESADRPVEAVPAPATPSPVPRLVEVAMVPHAVPVATPSVSTWMRQPTALSLRNQASEDHVHSTHLDARRDAFHRGARAAHSTYLHG